MKLLAVALVLVLDGAGCKQPDQNAAALQAEQARATAAEHYAKELETRITGLERTVDTLSKQVEGLAASGALGSGAGSNALLPAPATSTATTIAASKANGRQKNPFADAGCTKVEAGGSNCSTK